MRRVRGHHPEGRIDRDPSTSDPALRPGVIEESLEILGIHDSIDHTGRDPERARECRVQIRMALTLGFALLEYVERVPHVDRRFRHVFREASEEKIDALAGTAVAADDLVRSRSDRRVACGYREGGGEIARLGRLG